MWKSASPLRETAPVGQDFESSTSIDLGCQLRAPELSWWAFACAVTVAAAACAGGPSVQFDVGPVVACRDVTSDEFRRLNPNERLLEARFQVSSLIQNGDEYGLTQYLYRIESPHRSVIVVDYLPKTTLATNVVGNLGIENERERARSIGIDVSGRYDGLVAASASGSNGAKTKSSVRYELLPKLDLLAAGGTITRGAGVYFKLKPSKRTSLEGAKEFVLTLRTPASWRGDYVKIHCEAIGRQPADTAIELFGDGEQQGLWGSADFLVALYEETDEFAKRSAAQLVLAEQMLRETVTQNRHAIGKLTQPDISVRIDRLPKFSGPRLSSDWARHLLLHPERTNIEPYAARLPEDVRDAFDVYRAAKDDLRRLSGQGDELAGTTIFMN